jgi:hypothetical protein
VKVERADPSSELVLLKAPSSFNDQFCARLEETKIQSVDNVAGPHRNIVTAGYLKTGEVDLRYNFETNDQTLKNKIPIGRVLSSGLKHLKNFVEFRYVDVGPGMSGGALLDEKGDVLGITTRYIPFQDTPWIIPISDIQNFIDQKEILTLKNPKLFNLLLYQSLSHPYFIGDNVANMPGDNIANMPSTKTEKTKENPGILLFKEHHEGITDANDDKKRKLVSVRCNHLSKWEQIDGNNDYIYKCEDLTVLAESQKVYLDKEGFIPEKKRLEVLKNFKGKYDYSRSDYFGRLVVFKQKVRGIDGMEKISSLIERDEVVISEKNISVRLGNSARLDFEITFSEKNKSITLTKPDKTKLTCENRSFHKLICENKNEVFSLSMLNSKKKQLSYKYAIKNSNDNYSYYYGEFINKEN